MSPVIFKKINFLNYPIDLYKKLNGKRITGDHKTFRGFFFGIIVAVFITYIQYLLQKYYNFISYLDYSNWFFIGFIMGFGALLGDAIESFFKRQLNIKPGKPFIPFDQIDFIIGAFFLLYLFYDIALEIFFIALIITFFLHIFINHLAYFFRIREEKF